MENMKISTISEIKLVRQNLKTQMSFCEGQIKQECNVICSNLWLSLTYFIIEKGTFLTMSYLIRKLIKRRS